MPQSSSNGFAKDLVAFFKQASHLWGRCPKCDSVFRLSEAAISAAQEPPRDWLRRLERREDAVAVAEGEVSERERHWMNSNASCGRESVMSSTEKIALSGMPSSVCAKY